MEIIPRHNADRDPATSDPHTRASALDPRIDARALALIEQLAFRLAAHAHTPLPRPHEYTIRDKTDAARETAYVQLFHLIQEDGVIERWRNHARRYLYPGDGYKYWAMTDAEPQSRTLNRMRVEDDREQLRHQGQNSATLVTT